MREEKQGKDLLHQMVKVTKTIGCTGHGAISLP